VVKNLIAKSANQLFFGQLKDAHHGLIALENSEFAIINGKWVGNAVKDSGHECFIVGSHLCLRFPEALNLASHRHPVRELGWARNKNRWR
jgi:fructose-specific component phosphotransferase system IIB-like protein